MQKRGRGMKLGGKCCKLALPIYQKWAFQSFEAHILVDLASLVYKRYWCDELSKIGCCVWNPSATWYPGNSYMTRSISCACYTPVYYAKMTPLAVGHPNVQTNFLCGGIPMQCGSRNLWKIPVDQVIEEMVNKDTQTLSCTKGFSLKTAALGRCYITAEHRSTSLRQLREMLHHPSPNFIHADHHVPRIWKDHAEQGLEYSGTWMDKSHEWGSVISSEHQVPADIVQDINKAHKVGENAYQDFNKNHLETDPPVETFHGKLTRQR